MVTIQSGNGKKHECGIIVSTMIEHLNTVGKSNESSAVETSFFECGDIQEVEFFTGTQIMTFRERMPVGKVIEWIDWLRESYGLKKSPLVTINGKNTIAVDNPDTAYLMRGYENIKYLRGRKIVNVRRSHEDEDEKWGNQKSSWVFVLDTGYGLVFSQEDGQLCWSVLNLNSAE